MIINYVKIHREKSQTLTDENNPNIHQLMNK
jgi:hypothetical protein